MNMPKTTSIISVWIVVLLSLGVVTTAPAQTVYQAQLSGSHEVPAVTSAGTGEVTATLDGNTLTLEGSFSDLTAPVDTDIAGGAHIHMEMPGRNGGVTHALTVDLDPEGTSGSFSAVDNVFELEADELEALEARMLYVNIHTENFAGGEIRGQLMPEADAWFRANLSGTNQVPPVLTRANGAIIAELDGDRLTLSGAFQDLSDDYSGAHIHLALAGRNGGVEIPLDVDEGDDQRSGVFSAQENSFELDAEQIDALMERRFYVNVHSDAHPGGEIRGQIVPQVTSTMVANLSGSAVTAGIMSEGSGAIVAELDGDHLVVTGSFQDLGSNFANSHIHVGLPGRNGGVSVALEAAVDPDDETRGVYEAGDNTFELDEEQIAQMLTRNWYVNIHSGDYPGGEIRGQLLGESHAFFTARLDGIHAIPPVPSEGSGVVEVEFKGDRLVMIGAFDGLTSPVTAAHFHHGAVYESGGVALGVNPTAGENDTTGVFTLESNHFRVDEEPLIDDLFSEALYLNVHSDDFAGGELRGQVLSAPNAWPGTSNIELPEDEAMFVIEGDEEQTLEFAWTEADDPDGNTVVYIWQAALDETFSELVHNNPIGPAAGFNASYDEVDEFLDEQGVEPGETLTLYHRVVASDGNVYSISESGSFTLERGVVTGIDTPGDEVPRATRLDQNYPNPFNPATEITFAVRESGPVELAVYNMLGRRVAVLVSEDMSSGEYTVHFDASSLASGVYIYRLNAGAHQISRKMTLVK